ncbi:MAG: GNAT family N-acetyltransferase [Flavobacteriales bacterium]|nr:GNAT family N-acetyltransferase [Flavobacteriales bacterium]
MLKIGPCTTQSDLDHILDLQRRNLKASLSSQQVRSDGFVTVEHEPELLGRMNDPYPHIIAKEEEEVVGYALVMEERWRHEIEVLLPMFEEIDRQSWKGRSLMEWDYFIMGQVCVEDAYRGKGVFRKLFEGLKAQMEPHFDCCITEIALSNQRSLHAHLAVGFEEFHRYPASDGDEWILVVQDYR